MTGVDGLLLDSCAKIGHSSAPLCEGKRRCSKITTAADMGKITKRTVERFT